MKKGKKDKVYTAEVVRTERCQDHNAGRVCLWDSPACVQLLYVVAGK